MNWTLHRSQPAPITACWRAEEIVVTRGREVIDRLHAVDIERVTLVHAGEGESPGEVRAALFDLAGRTVVLSAASGINGCVLFERQAYWSLRNCIYWIADRHVSWPAVQRSLRRWFARPRVPQYAALTSAAAAARLDRAQITGPHTWDQRKQHRIDRRRPFRGHAIASTPVLS